jgi:cytochrome c oxidase subunit 2
VRPATIVEGLDAPITQQADDIDQVWNLFLTIGLAVLVLVLVLVFYIVVRFRRRDDRLPIQKHYNIPMEVTYTVIPLIVIMALFLVTVGSIWAIDDVENPPDLTVDVTAFQWQWQFDYPAAGVSVVGGGGGDNPIPELVLPARSTVQFDLESLDVIHSFWITAFRFKRDMIPGSPSSFRVDITDAPGVYPNAGVCAEFCGLDHARMQFSVRVLESDEFATWIAQQQASAGAEVGS